MQQVGRCKADRLKVLLVETAIEAADFEAWKELKEGDKHTDFYIKQSHI